MKPIFLALTLTGMLAAPSPAQQPPRGDRFGGPPMMFDTGRRNDMLLERWGDDFQLNADQQKTLKEIIEKAQAAAKQPQNEITALTKATKDAVKAGGGKEELDPLHQQFGEAQAKLAAIQSKAYGDILKLLNDDQKKNSDYIYETLGTLFGPAGRGAVMIRGGPGGPGARGGFGGPGGRGGADFRFDVRGGPGGDPGRSGNPPSDAPPPPPDNPPR